MTARADRSIASCLGLITARRGSRGLPDKHLRPLGGQPLIAWTLLAARGSTSLTRSIISTDDDRLIEMARRAGIEAPFLRPAALATDEATHLDVVRHAVDWYRADTGATPDLVVLLQPTSPFRTSADIDAAVRLARDRDAPVVGVAECREHPARCYRLSAGVLEPYVERPASSRRQDLPRAYRVNGAIYVFRPERLSASGEFVPSGALPLVMPVERSIDIDDEADLAWAEFCLASGRVRLEARTGP